MLPLPLKGAYDYALPQDYPRGTLVDAPLSGRRAMGVVWGPADDAVPDHKLKLARGLDGLPRLPEKLCDFVDWVANYTLSPPGMVLALALRAAEAYAPDKTRLAYRLSETQELERLTPARARVLEIARDGLARSLAALAREAGCSTSVVKGLAEAGHLIEVGLPEFAAVPRPEPDFAAPALNGEQQSAASHLVEAVRKKVFSATLLDGITGAGKTETYFEAIAESLRQKKQVLVLLPEIALTVQFLDRFAVRFGVRPQEWHSDLSAKQRKKVTRSVWRGEAQVVVGARSALFLPFQTLGLIIVDEEHEQAFKQEDGVVYHARDMAVVRAHLENCPIILSSATPSLETYVNARSHRYAHVKLQRRHGGAELPDVQLIDMREARAEPGSFISQPLREKLESTLAQGEQAMLFLNRRGYAPLTLCEACGHKMVCRDCSAWLVEHRSRKKLMCHHCGYHCAIPEQCPGCAAPNSLIACGPGVERVAEEFSNLFPEARMAIASSDMLHGPADTQAAIQAMAKGEIDVLIGTQIMAKGHHFPKLTLVGVVDADLGGSDGDMRARERTFQLLHQVSGRAGRAQHPGLVLLQTRNPQDAVMQALSAGDREAFLAQEIGWRERSHAPPFGLLAAIILSGPDGAKVEQAGRDLAKIAPAARGVKVWGPTPAFYHLLRGQRRERLLVQAEKSVDLQAYLRAWLAGYKKSNGVRLVVDIDPVSFF